MKTAVLTATLAIIAISSSGAFALSVQDGGKGKSAVAQLSDPDDQIPFPHVADDNQPVTNLQAQPAGNNGASFRLSSPSSEPGAFERAQQRMQQ